MAASTTLIVPPEISVLYTRRREALETLSLPAGVTTATVDGIQLYIPFSSAVSKSLTVLSLINDLATIVPGNSTSLPVFRNPASGKTTSLGKKVISLTSGDTLYIPVTGKLDTTVEIAALTNAFNPSQTTGSLTATSNTSLLAPTSSPASGTPPTSNGSTETTATPAQPPGSSSPTATSTSLTSTPSPGGTGVSPGAVAGSVVAVFIVAAILGALLTFWCLRRRSSGRASSPASSNKSDYGRLEPSEASHKQPQVAVPLADMSGWQKHLPQEKDDKTLANTFFQLFEQVQTYVEGFYEMKPAKPSDAAVQQLEVLASDDMPRVLPQTEDAVPILQAVLTRWIIHRISGRCSAKKSILPSEFTAIPEKNHWHMESSGAELGSAAEGRRGFLQAFSQWRRLTGFLVPDPREDPAFKGDLDQKIVEAIGVFDDAFAPWEKPGSNKGSRAKSLRGILSEASDAGVMLFTQPSTFMFDWSNKQFRQRHVIVLSPALVKRLDESGKTLSQPQMLLDARTAKI